MKRLALATLLTLLVAPGARAADGTKYGAGVTGAQLVVRGSTAAATGG